MIKQKTLNTLEYNKILEMLKDKAESEKTREIIQNMHPATSFEEAKLLQDETLEAYNILYTYALNPVFSIDNIENILTSAKKMSILSMADLLKISRALRIARNIHNTISKANKEDIPLIKSYTDNIFTNDNLEKDIESSILSETEMADSASRDLRIIRENIRKENDKIRQKLNNYITSSAYQKVLQDNIITIRKDRYVLPVRAEYKNMIDGIVHDQSSSGSTVYIEPMAIVNINNEIVSLKISEQAEITKILQAFTVVISSECDVLQRNFEIITELDLIFSRAKLAKEQKATSPVLNNKGEINIIQGRHPLINKDRVVPISINLGIDFDMLLITGPNTGGKTVTLKLVGLFTLMAMSGLMLPLKEGSKISYFETVCSDIGDEQSIEQSLSTFSSHMKNIVEITKECDENTLVLFDELGAGTDPEEGAALATAISEYLLAKGTKSLITSHYNELKEFSMVTDRVENASMDFNPTTYEPIYKLIIGVAGQSNALQIAKRLGLDNNIITNASSKISSEKKEFESIIAEAHKTKKEAEIYLDKIRFEEEERSRLLKEIEIERKKIAETEEELNNKIRKTSKELIEDSIEEADEIILKMKELLSTPTEQNIFTARKMKKQLENMSIKYEDNLEANYNEDTTPITVGSTVLLKSLGKEGVVENINQKNMVRIRLGNIRLDVKMTDIVKIKTETKKKKKEQVVNFSKPFSNEAVPTELNVIGKTVDEAIPEVDEWIDKAVLVGLTELRVIHGKGTGALRKGLQQHFKSHKQIKSFRNGRYGEGEMGATILTLK